MAGRPRARKGATWQARPNVVWLAPTGERLEGSQRELAARVEVRWRHAGRQHRRSFVGPGRGTEARRLEALLVAAATHDWPADEAGMPIPQPVDVVADPPSAPPAEPSRLVVPGPAESLSLSSRGAPGQLDDVEALARWYVGHKRSAQKRRGGGVVSAKTLYDYERDAGFMVEALRYAPGDPRAAAAGRKAGDSMLLDPDVGVRAADLLRLLDRRRATNVRTRAANERKLAKWQAAVEKEERRAARDGCSPVLPPAPALRREEAGARTMGAMARTCREMLTLAYGYEKLAYQPWTRAVDDHVPHPYAPAYTTKNVASPDEVWALVGAISTFERRSSDEKGRPVVVTGDRYAGFVGLAGREGPRPEEVVALRHSSFCFSGARCRVTVSGGEVYQPKAITGAASSRVSVGLKHRPPEATRAFDIDDPEVVALVRRHFERYVAAPDPGSSDPDRRDPRVFTTHHGAPIDLGNFAATWWKPVVEEVFGESDKAHLRGLEFGQLRSAAITSWLCDGWSLRRCAMKAGNSQGVIEKHYSGVLEEISYEEGARRREAAPGTTDLSALDEQALTELAESARVELHRRLDDRLGVP